MEMVDYQRKKMKRADAVTVSKLPFHFISEILSWLPVKSLTRFKFASKKWYSLIDREIRDYNFIAKHMDQVSRLELHFVYRREVNKVTLSFDNNFESVAFFSGLVLEKSLTDSQAFRIRNYASHQVIYLPLAHEATKRVDFAFNSSTHECKVICYYGEYREVGFQVLTVGKDEQWRPLPLPKDWLKYRGKRVPPQYLGAATPECKSEGDGHLMHFILDGQSWSLEIHTLDILSERFTTNTLPPGFLAVMRRIWIFYWNDRVAVADIEEGNVNMWVLENYKEHKWRKDKIILPVKFLNDLKYRFIYMKALSDEQLEFRFGDTTIYYDLKSESILKGKFTEHVDTILASVSFKQSLIALKGMKSEKVAGVHMNVG